jgi:DNA polymerase-3 subunit delta'
MKPVLHATTEQQLAGLIRRPKGAYLFAGQTGVGRATTARWLAKQLHCGNSAGCQTCHLIDVGNYADFITIEPGETNTIGIAQAQELLLTLSKSRIESRGVRIVVIDQAQTLTTEAQNSLLKTIEEPPNDTMIILVVSDPSALLETIRSRCETIFFAPLSDAIIQNHLEKELQAPQEQAILAAQLAHGALGLATQLVADQALYERYRALYELITGISSQSDFNRLMLAANFQDKTSDPQITIRLLGNMLQGALRQADLPNLPQAVNRLLALERFEQYRRNNVNGRAAWSRLLLEL